MPHDLNGLTKDLGTPGDKKIVQRADVVWSKMTLDPGEVLLVKVGKHMLSDIHDIARILDGAFKGQEERVIIYGDGDLDIVKARFGK